MNRAVLFSSKSDEWETPQALFDALHAEFNFDCDVAASADNAKLDFWFGPGSQDAVDALAEEWFPLTCWCNPPYSRGLQRRFIAKAAGEAKEGCTVVLLLPARTDTKAFHTYIWNAENHRPRAGVEVRFLPGRLKFSGSPNAAPFASMVVVFR